MPLFQIKQNVELALIFFVFFSSSITAALKNSTKIETRVAASEANVPCVCVPYYHCDSDNTLITTGEGLLDIRNARFISGVESMCEDDLEVCCRLPQQENQVSKCGIRRLGREQLLPRLDKDVADDGEFPWMVTIFQTKSVQQNDETIEKKIYQCQGTLISEKVVLTAAQCVQKSGNETKRLSIRAGQTDTMMTGEESPYQESEVQKVIVHKNYDSIKLRNNVALLVLRKSVTINKRVGITCLADRQDAIDEYKCLVIGWDQFLSAEDTQNQRSQTNLLKRRLESLMPRDSCTSILRKTPFGRRFTLPGCVICAGGLSGKTFCSREIGGPLVCPLISDSSQYVQVGITSWCINAGNLQTPSIFTSVLRQRNWIDKEMAKHRLDSSVYLAKTK